MTRAGWLSTNDVLVLGAVTVIGVDAVEFVIRAMGMGRKTTRTLFACDIAATEVMSPEPGLRSRTEFAISRRNGRKSNSEAIKATKEASGKRGEFLFSCNRTVQNSLSAGNRKRRRSRLFGA